MHGKGPKVKGKDEGRGMKDEELGFDREQGLMTGISDPKFIRTRKKEKKESGNGVINAGYLGKGPLMISR